MIGWLKRARPHACVVLCALAQMIVAPSAGAEDTIRIGTAKVAGAGHAFIAADKGYFAEEGFKPEFVFFDAPVPPVVAVKSGDVDVAAIGLTAAAFNLAERGTLRIVSGSTREVPGFPFFAIVASNVAFQNGLRTPRDIAGRSFALTDSGSNGHYILGRLAQKYGFDPSAIRLLKLQGGPNVISAMLGGQADVTILPGTILLPLVKADKFKLLGWAGDEVRYAAGVIMVSQKFADQTSKMERLLRAIHMVMRAYHDAFTGADERRADGAAAPEALGIIAKYLDQQPAQVANGLAYIDRDGKLDVDDVLNQIAWFKSQGMVKAEIEGKDIIDSRYVVPLR